MAETRLIHGFHAVIAKLRHAPEDVKEIYIAEGRQDARVRDVLKSAEFHKVRIMPMDAARLDGMAGGARHQGVLAKVDARQRHIDLDDVLDGLTEPALILVLDGVTDPHNLGACLRSADAFGAQAVIVPRDNSAPLNATARKAASGAADLVPLVAVTNLARTLRALQEAGVWIVGAAGEATQAITAVDLRGAVALVMGAEGSGMRRLTREHCDHLASIPLCGEVESLNVSVATGVFLYEARRQRTAP